MHCFGRCRDLEPQRLLRRAVGGETFSAILMAAGIARADAAHTVIVAAEMTEFHGSIAVGGLTSNHATFDLISAESAR